MFIAEREPPRLRLLTSMQVLADQRELNRKLVSAVSHPDPANIYIGFKLADDRVSLLHFQDSCLMNISSFVVQAEVTKELTLIKLMTAVVEGRRNMYIVIGYSNGVVSVYSFDNKLTKVRDLKSDSKEGVKDIIGDTNVFGVVRNTTVEFYSPIPSLNKVRACRNPSVLCNCHIASKLYISTHYGMSIYDRETLTREYSMDDCCFYCIEESKYSSNILYLGSADDSLSVLDFSQAERHVYVGFKSFVSNIIEKNQRLWAMGLDGRLAVFDVYPQRMGQEGPHLTDRTATRFREHIHELKHIVKAHNEGVWHMEIEQDLMVLLDSEGWVVVYELLFPSQQSITSRAAQ